MAAGAASHLHELREQAFGRAEIMREQHGIGVEHAHQPQAREVVALGHHLRAHQDVDLARVHRREQRFGAAFPARAVGVDAQDACLGKQLGQMLLDALGAAPHRRQVLVAAFGAGARHRRLVAAMVAMQAVAAVAAPVQHGEGRAARAVADPGAGLAMQHRRVAAAVQEDERLLLALQSLADGVQQLRRQALFHLQAARVHQLDRRQAAGARAARQRQPQVAAALGVLPGFQRGRGRTQHHRHIQVVRPPHRQIARRIAQAVLLLVGRVVFFIDDDQAQLGQRREYRHARAQQHARLAALGARPRIQPLAVGQAAVHHG